MNWDEVSGKWNQFKGAVKERWGKLTDDDLTVIAGKRICCLARFRNDTGSRKRQLNNRSAPGKLLPQGQKRRCRSGRQVKTCPRAFGSASFRARGSKPITPDCP